MHLFHKIEGCHYSILGLPLLEVTGFLREHGLAFAESASKAGKSGGGSMIVVGLTGGIATGKSTTSTIFREMNIPVHDADATVHGLMAPNGPATTAIAARFGAEVIAADGSVDRQRLGKTVFGDDELRRDAKAILHPLVAADRDQFLAQHRQSGTAVVVLDVPLLFETGVTPYVI